MATTNSDQMSADRVDVRDKGAKMRFLRFSYTQSGAGADGDEINLAEIPTGPNGVRVWPNYSRVTAAAITGATLDIGHRKYENSFTDKNFEAEDPNAFASAIDIGSGVAAVPFGTVIKFDMSARRQVTAFATVNGAAIPDGWTLEGVIAYSNE